MNPYISAPKNLLYFSLFLLIFSSIYAMLSLSDPNFRSTPKMRILERKIWFSVFSVSQSNSMQTFWLTFYVFQTIFAEMFLQSFHSFPADLCFLKYCLEMKISQKHSYLNICYLPIRNSIYSCYAPIIFQLILFFIYFVALSVSILFRKSANSLSISLVIPAFLHSHANKNCWISFSLFI
mgnify:CR=1 FL=1